MDENQKQIGLDKASALFENGIFKDSATDIYKAIPSVFESVIKTYDKIGIEMHNQMFGEQMMECFQLAYSTGKCEVSENLILLKGWIEKFAYQAKRNKVSEENYMFLSAGIILGMENMIRELNRIRGRG